MTSTVATVRTAVANAIKAIAVSSLGFDDSNGNVKEYLLEHVDPSTVSTYLRAKVSGKYVVRCIAVHVTSREELNTMNFIFRRIYRIMIREYASIGTSGAGVQLVIGHLDTIWGAIRALNGNLSNTCDRFLSMSETDLQVDGSESDLMVIGTRILEYEKVNPDY